MVFMPQAGYGQLFTAGKPITAPMQDVAAEDPFVWGAGGKRMSAEDIAQQREIAAALMQSGSDYSPVGHWTQGLARVGQAVSGVMAGSRADKAAEANQAYEDQIAQALLGGGGDQASIAGRVLTDPNLANLQPVAKMIYDRANPKAVNNDTINDFNWYKTLSEDDRAIYDQLHPIYKMGPDGLPYPVARSSMGQAAMPTAPVGKLTPLPDEGGPQQSAAGGF